MFLRAWAVSEKYTFFIIDLFGSKLVCLCELLIVSMHTITVYILTVSKYIILHYYGSRKSIFCNMKFMQS